MRNQHEEGEDPKCSTTSVEETVAIRLLTPGCWSEAGFAPASVRHQKLFLCVCWCLGCAQNPAGTVPLGHIICCLSSSGTVLLTTEVLSWFLFVLVPRIRLNGGEMNILATENYESPVPALVRHRRKKELGVGFCQCISFYFSYFNKCIFREKGRSGNSSNHRRY